MSKLFRTDTLFESVLCRVDVACMTLNSLRKERLEILKCSAKTKNDDRLRRIHQERLLLLNFVSDNATRRDNIWSVDNYLGSTFVSSSFIILFFYYEQ